MTLLFGTREEQTRAKRGARARSGAVVSRLQRAGGREGRQAARSPSRCRGVTPPCAGASATAWGPAWRRHGTEDGKQRPQDAGLEGHSDAVTLTRFTLRMGTWWPQRDSIYSRSHRGWWLATGRPLLWEMLSVVRAPF